MKRVICSCLVPVTLLGVHLALGSGTETVLAEKETILSETVFSENATVSETNETVKIDAEHFPDQNFRTYVKKNIDKDGNGVLSATEIAAVSTIDVEFAEIRDLTGVSYFSELHNLCCGNNYISELDVSALKKLKILSCQRNNLTKLTLGNHPALVELIGSENSLTEIDVSHCPKLQELDLPYSKLSSLDLTNCPDLILLDLHDNRLSSLDLSKCTKLENLAVSQNGMKQIDLSGLQYLHELYIGNNDLTTLDLTKNHQLEQIWVETTNLQELKLGEQTRLDTLRCSSNHLSELDLSKVRGLKQLDVRENKLTSLDLSRLHELEYLDCSYNKLTNLDVRMNPSLMELYCIHNSLTGLDLRQCRSLYFAGCAYNLITSLQFPSHSKLDRLDCSDNLLTSINLSDLPELTCLHISGNPITKLSFPEGLPIGYIECANMGLTELDVSSLKKLASLDCAWNKLTRLDLSGNPDIEELNCSNNLLTELDLSTANNLRQLSCKKNALKKLDLNSEELAFLFATENDLQTLDVRTCPQMSQLVKEHGIVKSRDGRYFLGLYFHDDLSTSFLEFDQTVDLTGFTLPKPDPGFDEFVERLYTIALNRPSEQEGKQYWVDQVTKKGATGADCARFLLLGAPEFMKRNLSNEDFLETLYQVFFNRGSDPEGKAFYLNALKNGTGRAYVVECFIESREWCDVCADYGVKPGVQNPCGTKPSRFALAFVIRLFNNCLLRQPDEDGLNFWALGLTNGQKSGAEVARFFFNSPEIKNSNQSNEEFLYRLYETFFDRSSDYMGMRYWDTMLENGIPREEVVEKFIYSKEFAKICADYGIVVG